VLLDLKDFKDPVEIQDSVALLVIPGQLDQQVSEVQPVLLVFVVVLEVLVHKVKSDQ